MVIFLTVSKMLLDLFKNWIMESLQEHTIKESSLTLKLDQQVLKFPAVH